MYKDKYSRELEKQFQRYVEQLREIYNVIDNAQRVVVNGDLERLLEEISKKPRKNNRSAGLNKKRAKFDFKRAVKIRMKNKLSQAELAEIIDIDAGRLSRYETGKVTPCSKKSQATLRYLGWLKIKGYNPLEL